MFSQGVDDADANAKSHRGGGGQAATEREEGAEFQGFVTNDTFQVTRPPIASEVSDKTRDLKRRKTGHLVDFRDDSVRSGNVRPKDSTSVGTQGEPSPGGESTHRSLSGTRSGEHPGGSFATTSAPPFSDSAFTDTVRDVANKAFTEHMYPANEDKSFDASAQSTVQGTDGNSSR
ncbi:hypothetical protein QFC22_005248 [Naganishia vaughanmartiniae]|uniref:Uncharacterized protein n=1 Tax=Naganishia vaughanmartiniae TaxID=1424756 RepID=A0ACC2WW00_9TREE|nr:hypothetical protein QFC22_005248 [Naganishia vaughanmartiniae]